MSDMWIYSCIYHVDGHSDWDKRCGICSKCIADDIGFVDYLMLEEEYGPHQPWVDGFSLARTMDESWFSDDRSYWTEEDWAEEHAKGRKLNSKKWKNEPVFTLMDDFHPYELGDLGNLE